MTERSAVRLGDVADLVTGFPFSSGGYSDNDDDIRLVRGDNVAQGVLRWDGVKRWPADETAGLDSYRLQGGDVILAMDRPWIEAGLKYAAISQSDLPALLVQRVTRLRGTDRLLTSFLKYVIGSRDFTNYVMSVQTGTGIPHISGGQIRAYEFLLPSVSEQRDIAEVLGSLDAKIEANGSLAAALSDYGDALASRLFRDPADNWPVERLRNLVTLTRGVAYSSADLGDARAKDALVSLKSFGRYGGYRSDGLKPYRGSHKASQEVQPDDILVAHTDLTQDADVVGRAIRGVSDPRFGHLVASMDLSVIRPARADVSPEFLFATLASEPFRQHCRARANGTTVLHLPSSAVLEFEARVPPSDTVGRLTQSVRPVWARQDALVVETSALIDLRETLLDELVTGRIGIDRRPDIAYEAAS